jgi:hypothetical protein
VINQFPGHYWVVSEFQKQFLAIGALVAELTVIAAQFRPMVLFFSAWPGRAAAGGGGRRRGPTAPARHRRTARLVHAQKAWLCMHNG